MLHSIIVELFLQQLLSFAAPPSNFLFDCKKNVAAERVLLKRAILQFQILATLLFGLFRRIPFRNVSLELFSCDFVLLALVEVSVQRISVFHRCWLMTKSPPAHLCPFKPILSKLRFVIEVILLFSKFVVHNDSPKLLALVDVDHFLRFFVEQHIHIHQIPMESLLVLRVRFNFVEWVSKLVGD